jgi:cell division septation protein DedD
VNRTEEPEEDYEEEEAPRSIFQAAWFRVVLVLLVIGVIGAVAVPYVLDVVNAPEPPRPALAPAPPAPKASAPTPSAPTPSAPVASAPTPPAQGSTAPKASVVAEAPKPEPKPAAKPAEKPEPKVIEKPAEKVVAKKTPPAEKTPAPRASAAPKASEGGDYFVQVGAFREEATAKRVAAQLRGQNYPVDESVKRVGNGGSAAPAPRAAARPATSGADRYDVIVSGGSSAEINTRLAAKGLASEPAGDSVRIRPSLPLRDAVALSKDLGSEGFKVQVRRGTGGGGGSAEPAPSAAVTSEPGGQTLYRVRVGGYPDRASAQAVLKELQDKGFQPFIAKGRE